jgi:hypothetical protein
MLCSKITSNEEIALVSALDTNNCPIPSGSTIACNTSTRFSYFTNRYKFAFVLDMTDSCTSISIDGGHIYLESLTNCLCVLLCSLAQPLQLPGCELKLQPEIDISVYVYLPFHRPPNHQILVHGMFDVARVLLIHVLFRLSIDMVVITDRL